VGWRRELAAWLVETRWQPVRLRPESQATAVQLEEEEAAEQPSSASPVMRAEQVKVAQAWASWWEWLRASAVAPLEHLRRRKVDVEELTGTVETRRWMASVADRSSETAAAVAGLRSCHSAMPDGMALLLEKAMQPLQLELEVQPSLSEVAAVYCEEEWWIMAVRQLAPAVTWVPAPSGPAV
jgi:hypothetical protein